MLKSKLITVEGGEGVGKTTFVSGLADLIRREGCQLVQTREPGGTELGEAVRNLFHNPPGNQAMHAQTELLLLAAARSQHVAQVIKPALEAGHTVLCDRYTDSTRVYQGMYGDLAAHPDFEPVLRLACGGLEPHSTLLIDLDVDTISERLRRRRDCELTRFDQQAKGFHERIRQGFLSLAKRYSDRIRVLDGTMAPDELLAAAFRILREGDAS